MEDLLPDAASFTRCLQSGIGSTLHTIPPTFNLSTLTLPSGPTNSQNSLQPGQTTRISNPTTVVVYIDRNTQMLSTSPLAVSSVARFYGRVFNKDDA